MPVADSNTALVLDWYKFALYAERHTEGYRAPVAARMYAYAGIAAWEAALAIGGNQGASLSGRFPELTIPKTDPAINYYLPSVLNGCYNAIFEKMFLSAPFVVEQLRVQLHKTWENQLMPMCDTLTLHQSEAFGRSVALAVYDWSATDAFGHMAHLHNFDREYHFLEGEGNWQPCADFPTPALLPHWGQTRTFLIEPDSFLAAPLPPFSTDPHSAYYVQALEIYTINAPLSHENQWIAEFWSDDHPGLTFSSAGRWISIANQVMTRDSPPVWKLLETYLRLGLALSDASVACWKAKYQYNLLRPETYIRLTLQPDWRPILHTPPFPAYPSGHAMISAAAAEVLTHLYGDHYAMTDHSHDGRREFLSESRHFKSFYEMAYENAFSRIALGVHFRMDCEEGTRIGLLLGKVVALQEFDTTSLK